MNISPTPASREDDWQLRQRIHDDGDVTKPGFAGRQDDNDDGGRVARSLRGRSNAWRRCLEIS